MVSVFSTIVRRANLVPNGAGKYWSQAVNPNLLPQLKTAVENNIAKQTRRSEIVFSSRDDQEWGNEL
jgi:hypothetical protein